MTFPFWCVVIVAVLPYFLSSAAGYFRVKQFGELDNHHPRAQAARLEGTGARTYAAHQNALEAVPIFAAAVLIAHLAGADPRLSSMAAGVFVVARISHAVAYVANVAAGRSLAFLVGLGCCIWLFAIAARA